MDRGTQPTTAPGLALVGAGDRWALTGDLVIRTLAEARRSLRDWLAGRKHRALDLAQLRELDTPGALLLCELRDSGIELKGLRAEHEALLALVDGLDVKPLPASDHVPRWRQLVIGLGRGADGALHDTYDVIVFVGRAVSALGYALTRPRYLWPASISRHIAETGIHARGRRGLLLRLAAELEPSR